MRVRLGGSRHSHARPGAGLRLPAAYDLLDVPAAAGHRVLLQLERVGAPLGPVLTVPGGAAAHEGRFEVAGGAATAGGHPAAAGGHAAGTGNRLQFFVEAGSTASFLADLKDLGWDPADTDIRTIGVVLAAGTPLPPAGSPRWVRPPEPLQEVQPLQAVQPVPEALLGRAAVLPPARLLLGALAHACRRAEQRRAHALSAAGRAG